MRTLMAIGCLALATIAGGCKQEPAKFDASTADAYRRSVEVVRAGLPEADRPKLDAAIQQVTLHAIIPESGSGLEKLAALGEVAKDPASVVSRIAPLVNGRTGPELIAVAADLKQQREQRQLAAIDGEIATLDGELQKAKQEDQAARAVLDAIKIEGARYYWSVASDYRLDEAVIAFKITNHSDRAISKIVMNGILETPGRSVPWVKDDFSYVIKGGMEPGESQSMFLSPRRTSAWSNSDLKHRKDLVLTVTLTGIEEANGAKLGIATSEKIGRAEERIKELRKQRAGLTGSQT